MTTDDTAGLGRCTREARVENESEERLSKAGKRERNFLRESSESLALEQINFTNRNRNVKRWTRTGFTLKNIFAKFSFREFLAQASSTAIKDPNAEFFSISFQISFDDSQNPESSSASKWNTSLCSHCASLPLWPHHQQPTSLSWRTTSSTTATPTPSGKSMSRVKSAAEDSSIVWLDSSKLTDRSARKPVKLRTLELKTSTSLFVDHSPSPPKTVKPTQWLTSPTRTASSQLESTCQSPQLLPCKRSHSSD